VSEWILNGTSAQSGYTVPFTLNVLENTQVKNNSEKANNTKHSKQNYKTTSVQSPLTTVGQKMRLAYSIKLHGPGC